MSPVAAGLKGQGPMAALGKRHVLALFMSRRKRDGVLVISCVGRTQGFRTLGPPWLRVAPGKWLVSPSSTTVFCLWAQIFESGVGQRDQGALLTLRWDPRVPGFSIFCYIKLSCFAISTMREVRQGLTAQKARLRRRHELFSHPPGRHLTDCRRPLIFFWLFRSMHPCFGKR